VSSHLTPKSASSPKSSKTAPRHRKAMQKITQFLWFDDQLEEAVNFYVSVFKNAKRDVDLAVT
jgi:hypothetical protein